ncbi:MAG: hypothetical protein H6R42_512 [Nitrospirae bacterium]|nr:hypothetical protein [Nitrospirota bacterium]
MTKKNGVTLCRTGQSLCLVFLCATMGGFIFSGCSKEKSVETRGPSGAGACEVFDKLPGDVGKSVEVNYGNKVKLLGISTNKLSPNKLKVSYYWQPQEDLGEYKQVFVHFTDAENKGLFQNDHLFCQKPFGEIKGKIVKETYTVDVPQSAAGKEIEVKVGVYSPVAQSNARLKAESAGTSVDDLNTRASVEKIKF